MFFMENAAPATRRCSSRGAGKTLRRGRPGRRGGQDSPGLTAKQAVLRFRMARSAMPDGLYCGLKQAVPGRFCAPFAGLRLCGRCVSRYRPAVCVMLRKLRFLRPAMPAGAGKLLTASLLSRFFAMLHPACAARWGGAEGCAPARKPMPMRAKKAAGVAEFGFFALTLQP